MSTRDTTTIKDEIVERFHRRVTAVGGLPTLPKVAAEVLRLAHDPNSSLKAMAAVISTDAPLTGRLLKVANSAFYGLSQQVGSLSTALVLLGMKNVTNIVTSISIFQTMTFGREAGAFTRHTFWEHSAACGRACDIVGRLGKLSLGGEGFVAGVMHDVGKIVLDAIFHNDFMRILSLAAAEKMPMWKAEREVLKVDHAQIGSWLAENWRLPESIVTAIALHHEEPRDPAAEPLAAALQIADAVVRGEGIGFPGFDPPPGREELARRSPRFAALPWDALVKQLRQESQGVTEFLQAAGA